MKYGNTLFSYWKMRRSGELKARCIADADLTPPVSKAGSTAEESRAIGALIATDEKLEFLLQIRATARQGLVEPAP